MKARFVNAFKNALALVIAVVFTIATAEIVIRWLDLPVPPKNKNIAPKNYYLAHDILGYDIRPNASAVKHHLDDASYDIFSNRFGCFDYDRLVPRDYILALGDSFTWGFTPLDRKWTTLLEKKLDKFILKCGVSGFGVKQALHKGKTVISEIGFPPAAVIYMYYTNDLNDDVLTPHKTVYSGYLVSLVKSLNLETGEVKHRSQEEIESRFRKFKAGSWSNWFREFRYNLVTYRLYQSGKDILERKIRSISGSLFSGKGNSNFVADHNSGQRIPSLELSIIKETAKIRELLSVNKAVAQNATKDPSYPKIIKNMYQIMLMDYLDSIDRPWFIDAVKSHQSKILEMANFVRSLGAKFILIDINGDLTREQFRDIREELIFEPDLYYMNLKEVYSNQKSWKNDIHWNIEGNSDVTNHIYQYFRKHLLFSD